MRKSVAYVVSILLFVLPAFAQSGSTASGSIRGDVFTKGTNGEPAVLPGVLIVLHGPITMETESDAKGAFAVDGLPPGMYDIEASAPGLNAALAVEVKPGTPSVVPIDLSVGSYFTKGIDRAYPDKWAKSYPSYNLLRNVES